ncbi:DNA-binding protein RFX2-like isoform X2 [Porites lutea]|uniref:DNA-binding protein RFX2-like isoform X2 n=1 Tax=Porites lutea TaxID=51062 RepID=UPI003CC6D67E
MQGIAGLVLMPHKTIETSCSISSATPTDANTGEKNVSPSKSTEATVKEDKQPKTFAQAGISHQDEAKINCSKPPGGNHIRDLILSFDKVPIVLSSNHTSPATKSTRLIQDGDRYIFLVEDNRSSKVSSSNVGADSRAARSTDDDTEVTAHDEEEEETEFSDGGSEGSLEDVRQHHGIIKTQKQDDPDYLTLFEAHQRRLEDVGSPSPGFPTAEVHYVEAPSDHTMYPNGTTANAYHYNDGTMFAQQATTPYLDPGQQNFTTVTTPGAVSSGQTLLQVNTPSGPTMQAQRHPITHTTRASPATVQWLVDNYETAEGVSLPRSTLYNHYLQHCQANKLDAVNAASFGKLIRSVFMGLRTRRLGTRGNSKYHYYGIRIKPSSPLNQLSDHDSQVAMRQSPSTQKRLKPATRLEASEAGESASQSQAVSTDQQAQQNQMQQHQQYLGDVTQGLPEFDELDLKDCPLPEGITDHDLDTFVDMYREHCEAFLDVVVNLQFTLVESLWQTFWRHSSTDTKSGSGAEDDESNRDGGDDGEYESRLSQSKLVQLCEYEPIVTFVKASDHLLYQTLVEILIPDVLRPIPASLTQAVRNFAKGLEAWLVNSLDQIPKKMSDVKVSTCSAFAQTLRRYTSLNHLAQAARAVLQNSSQITQMLTDLNRVDFANVQEQASWVCQCDDSMVYRLEQDFKLTLQQQNSLEQWASWLESVVDQVLKQHQGTNEFPKAARQFLLKWSFYSSMIIRDLTLRSAASFGSFHLIRLLYDEYMFYLVEHKVAKAIGVSPMAVMGEFVGLGSALSMGLDSVDSNLLTEQTDLAYGSKAPGSGSSPTRPSGSGSLEPEAKRPRPS